MDEKPKRKHRRKMCPSEIERVEDLKKHKGQILCKCPICGNQYYREFFYTGRLPARKNCNACAISLKNCSTDIYQICL